MIFFEKLAETPRITKNYNKYLNYIKSNNIVEYSDKLDIYYKRDYINNKLKSSYYKCHFCNCNFLENSTIEHIKCKSKNFNLLASYDNLLLACNTCNSSKNTKDVDLNIYINPTFTVNKNVLDDFCYSFSGKIYPSNSTSEYNKNRILYMIDLYSLNRKKLVIKRGIAFRNTFIECSKYGLSEIEYQIKNVLNYEFSGMRLFILKKLRRLINDKQY